MLLGQVANGLLARPSGGDEWTSIFSSGGRIANDGRDAHFGTFVPQQYLWPGWGTWLDSMNPGLSIETASLVSMWEGLVGERPWLILEAVSPAQASESGYSENRWGRSVWRFPGPWAGGSEFKVQLATSALWTGETNLTWNTPGETGGVYVASKLEYGNLLSPETATLIGEATETLPAEVEFTLVTGVDDLDLRMDIDPNAWQYDGTLRPFWAAAGLRVGVYVADILVRA